VPQGSSTSPEPIPLGTRAILRGRVQHAVRTLASMPLPPTALDESPVDPILLIGSRSVAALSRSASATQFPLIFVLECAASPTALHPSSSDLSCPITFSVKEFHVIAFVRE
jgi:hypothetical protein